MCRLSAPVESFCTPRKAVMLHADNPPRKRQKDGCAEGAQAATSSVSDDVTVQRGQGASNSPLNIRILLALAQHEGARRFVSTKSGCIGICPLRLHHVPQHHPVSHLGLTDVRVPTMERLAAIGCGLTALLSLSFASPQGASAPASRAFYNNASAICRYVTRARASALIEREFQDAQRVRAACDFAAAAARYAQLTALGHGASHAELAWILIDGREGLKRDISAGFSAAQLGSRLGCMHSRGVLSYCHVYSYACSMDLELGYVTPFHQCIFVTSCAGTNLRLKAPPPAANSANSCWAPCISTAGAALRATSAARSHFIGQLQLRG